MELHVLYRGIYHAEGRGVVRIIARCPCMAAAVRGRDSDPLRNDPYLARDGKGALVAVSAIVEYVRFAARGLCRACVGDVNANGKRAHGALRLRVKGPGLCLLSRNHAALEVFLIACPDLCAYAQVPAREGRRKRYPSVMEERPG